MLVRRLALALAAAAALAAVAPAAQAQPPQPPLACELVLTLPASQTGTEQALANKVAAYTQVCGFPPP
jgi:ABC-type glycerol-3-phosphate transport system substrate-binding protein